ncbi:hypothetical protein [Spiroplasma endosymbiont of Clivina fossor]|uniref:hypothetical protein n=1 Tax=Spiroplasma endosymbiont of Clivina fossor TaxID=3066282 RepID=UPI00313AA859
MYKKVKVKIVILHKSLLKLSSWWFFLFYQEFSTKLKTNSTLCVTKTTINPEASYRNLNKISKLQSSLKEALIHYHGLGFTNIQNYLNLWKWKYQHKGLTPNQQTAVLYFNV